jgi:hypothetical protein
MFGLTHAGDAVAGATCIHASSMLNKMAVNCFTIEFNRIKKTVMQG